MEFAWNTQKNGIGAVKGLEKEQEREGKITNKEIDPEKTKLNYDLVQSELNLYQRVKQRVEEVKPVSRVQKNSVVDYSNIITVPQEQFKEWGVDKSKEYLNNVYDYFCKEFGKENVVSAKVHLDETTPHMHLHFVPVSEEGKLQARKVMTPKRINKIHTEAPKYLQEMGFDVFRGKGKTEKSLEIKEYKAEKLQDKINDLEQKLLKLTNQHELTLAELKKEKERVVNQFKTVKNVSDSLCKLEEHTKGVINRLESVTVEKPKIPFFKGLSISEEDYSILRSLAKTGETKALENIKLKTRIGALEQKLEEVNKKEALRDTEIRLKAKEYDEVISENRKFKKDRNTIETAINNMGDDFIKKLNAEIKSVRLQENVRKRKSFDIER